MKLTRLVVAILLAAASFWFGRQQYISKRSATFVNPFNNRDKASVKFVNPPIFGDWVKEEWIFAIAIPAGLLAGGLVLTVKK